MSDTIALMRLTSVAHVLQVLFHWLAVRGFSIPRASQRIGHAPNVLYAWKHGDKQPKTCTPIFALARLTRLDLYLLDPVARRRYHVPSPSHLAAVMRAEQRAKFRNRTAFAVAAGTRLEVTSRWFAGEVVPSPDSLFAALDALGLELAAARADACTCSTCTRC